MNLSMKWLSEYVSTEGIPPHDYAAAMTMTGSKVEGFSCEDSEIKNVVIGKLLSVEKHPNADTLVVCKVDVGGETPIQICTGASNVKAGDIVPVALHGSTLPGGVSIRKGKLRGEESNGMLCSLSELGLTTHDFPYADESGIFLLEGTEAQHPLGSDAAKAIGLDDVSVEFEITSNRPDCLSMIGLARESAVTFDRPLRLHDPLVKGSGGDIKNHLSVTVESPALCLRYMARVVKNVKIGPSPRWMRERLRACGVRPISNIVDITNYVMLEYGQPMHAFDLGHVAGGHIIARNAKPGETITTLEGEERLLSPEMLVIADAEKPSAIAGIKGGKYSGIYEDTTTIVFESANFLGSSVRITAKKLGMRTESSGRYEKGLDPNICPLALARACELVELLGAGDVVDGVIDVDNSQKEPTRIPLEPDWINRFIGIQVPVEEMKHTLRRLDFRVEGETVIPPSFRADVEHKADVAEEIARIYGYDKIPVTTLRGSSKGQLTPRQKFERALSQSLLSQGLYEVSTYSFISPKYYDNIRLPADSPLRNSVQILNPLGEDTSVMRTTVLPSMLEVLARNYSYRNLSASLYELATEYRPIPGADLPEEKLQISLGLYGEKTDFFTLKGIVETLLGEINQKPWTVEPVSDNPTFHPGRCARLLADGVELGILGEVHPLVGESYGIDCRCYLCRLSVDALFENQLPERQYTPLPKFPSAQRDIALLCEDALPVQSMEQAIRTAVGSTLEKVELFDVYRGAQIPDGKKSVAWSLVLRHKDRTLTDEESDNLVKKAVTALEKLGAILRS